MVIEISLEEYISVAVRFKGGRGTKWWLSWLCTYLQSDNQHILMPRRLLEDLKWVLGINVP